MYLLLNLTPCVLHGYINSSCAWAVSMVNVVSGSSAVDAVSLVKKKIVKKVPKTEKKTVNVEFF